jgi:hypothetical protein
MHKLFAGSSVEMRFRVASPTYELEAFKAALAIYGDGAIVEQPVQIPLPPGHPVIQCAPIEPVASGPPTEPVAEPLPGYARCGRPPATQTWLLDMDGTVVAFDIMTFPDTPPALLAEAEAAIRSVRVDRTPEGEPRLVFELTQGWDSG